MAGSFPGKAVCMKRNFIKGIRILQLVIALHCFVFSAAAQDPGTLTIDKDPQIDALISRRLELRREEAGTTRITAEGYRVQIFSGANREETYKVQAGFKTQYPRLNTYISYDQPNYKIRVGDFRTRLEAERFMNQIRKNYPTLFIFKERINFSR